MSTGRPWLDGPGVSVVRRFRYYSALRLLAPLKHPFRGYLIGCFTGLYACLTGMRERTGSRTPVIFNHRRITVQLHRRYEASVGHMMVFHTMPPAHTLVRRVNWNAFTSIVQARPCPVFGRPVHPRGGPH